MSKGEETRERILDTAFRLAARDGLEGLSLSGLAGELGMSKSGLFAHFGSKEELQLAMLRTASDRFVANVLQPALRQPRGLARVKALFDNWRRWGTDPSLPGGCIFVAASTELDDRPGPVRDFVAAQGRDLMATIARAARIAVEAGHFRRDLDVDQFAFEMHGIYLAFHDAHRLLRDPKADQRARRAWVRLLEDASPRQ